MKNTNNHPNYRYDTYPKPDAQSLPLKTQRSAGTYFEQPARRVNRYEHLDRPDLPKPLLRKLGATATALAVLMAGQYLTHSDQRIAKASPTHVPTIEEPPHPTTSNSNPEPDLPPHQEPQLSVATLNQQSSAIETAQPSPEAPLTINKTVTPPPNSGKFKSFMDYRTITNRASRQYELLHSSNIITNEQGLRCYQLDDQVYPLVAVGSGVTTQVGQRLDISIQANNQPEHVLQAVVGDLKADKDTDSTHTYHVVDKSMVEFLVDTPQLRRAEPLVTKMGNLSYTVDGQLAGAVTKIDVLDQIVDY